LAFLAENEVEKPPSFLKSPNVFFNRDNAAAAIELCWVRRSRPGDLECDVEVQLVGLPCPRSTSLYSFQLVITT